ncbi:hypothetical protein DSLASN_30610 [Desulfoluna limicola]|uniref:DUF4194 domain-containing protein n=1 Tax=Desulfoluna limicola TaxID=2810562 RepID=A0ABM7PIM7_9BACT|nr:DUF4194 domain-containing protein [Desulfoluna limicola]BCS97429.1 hypothetical protein DSLASN_30610 [Desulfoluna limicola]
MIKDALESALDKHDVSSQDFQRVIHRLLGYQVIYRGESLVENELYDLYFRIHELVDEYLGEIGFTVVHHQEQKYLVCYPPGAVIPGVADDPNGSSVAKLARNLQVEEKLLLISLRLEFEQKLAEGELDDKGTASVLLEQFVHTYQSLGHREMPGNVELQKLMRFFKKLRIVEYETLGDGEGYIGIRSTILAFSLHTVKESLDRFDEALENDQVKEETA